MLFRKKKERERTKKGVKKRNDFRSANVERRGTFKCARVMYRICVDRKRK